jgi:hypothetical protein
LIAIATIIIKGDKIIIKIIENIKSKILFKIIAHQSNFECLYSNAIILSIFSGE